MTSNDERLPDDGEMEQLSPDLRAALQSALTPDQRRAATRDRLTARAVADARGRELPHAKAAATPALFHLSRGARPHVSTRLFVGVSVALAASLVLLVRTRMEREDYRAIYAATDRSTLHRIDSLTALVSERDALMAALTGPQVRVVGLSSSATKSPRALMFWDKATDKWTFVAHNLAPLGVGRTYQLWLVTADRKISAGTFTVNANGDATLQATYALNANALKAVAVTEEPAGGVPVATGQIVVIGTVGSQ